MEFKQKKGQTIDLVGTYFLYQWQEIMEVMNNQAYWIVRKIIQAGHCLERKKVSITKIIEQKNSASNQCTRI